MNLGGLGLWPVGGVEEMALEQGTPRRARGKITLHERWDSETNTPSEKG